MLNYTELETSKISDILSQFNKELDSVNKELLSIDEKYKKLAEEAKKEKVKVSEKLTEKIKYWNTILTEIAGECDCAECACEKAPDPEKEEKIVDTLFSENNEPEEDKPLAEVLEDIDKSVEEFDSAIENMKEELPDPEKDDPFGEKIDIDEGEWPETSPDW